MKSPLHVLLAVFIAILSTGLLLLGMHETGQAANNQVTQGAQTAPFSGDSPPPVFSNTYSLNVVGNNAYLFGNFANTRYKKFDFTQQKWSIGNTSSVVTSTREGYASAVMSDSIYIMGGVHKNQEQMSEVWKYDPNSGTWVRVDTAATTPLPHGRAGGTFTAAPSVGKFLAFGGAPSYSYGHDAVWIYDNNTGFWTTYGTSNPQGDRPGHSAGVMDNWMYLVGGVVSETGSFVQKTDYTGTMYPTVHVSGTLHPEPRKNQATVFDSVSNSIYVFGGESFSSTVFTDSWHFDLDSGVWTRLENMPQPLTNSKAVGWYSSSHRAAGHSSDVFGGGFQILIVGDQITDDVKTSYVFDGSEYEQKELPRIPVYLPIIIRN